MKLSQFQRLLDIYGTDLLSWPEAQKSSAAQLIANSSQARHHFEAAQIFAESMKRALVFPGDAGVTASRVIARAMDTINTQERQPAWPKTMAPVTARPWPLWVKTGTGGFMAALIFLLGMGFGSARDAGAGADSTAIQSLIVNGSYGSNAVL